jgi:hypothetical protein
VISIPKKQYFKPFHLKWMAKIEKSESYKALFYKSLTQKKSGISDETGFKNRTLSLFLDD